MKKFGFIINVALIIIGYSEKTIAADNWSTSGSCGTYCTYSIDEENNLTITGTGNGASISRYFFEGNNATSFRNYRDNCVLNDKNNCVYNSTTKSTFKNVTISGIDNFYQGAMTLLHITGDLSISDYSNSSAPRFLAAQGVVEGNIILDNSFTNIGSHAFWETHILGNLIIPNTVQTIQSNAFRWAVVEGSIIIPDSINMQSDAFFNTQFIGDGTLYCKGKVETCKLKLQNAGASADLLAKVKSYDDFCPDGCSKCDINKICAKCKTNYKKIETFCNRIKWTPAEAAKVLNEDNNTVTLTFKKQ